MARISTNISSLIAQHNLAKVQQNLDLRLERLSTGLRLNRGADDPAGLIVSERLRAELSGLDQGIKNAERASSVIATAEASLTEASDLLNSIKALVVEAANSGAISLEEKRANQLQIDSAIESITRISNTASFAGLKLLDGSLDYLTSGLDDTEIARTRINAVRFGTRSEVDVDVEVIESAQVASLYLSTASFTTAGQIPSAITLEIAGPTGVQVLDFASGLTIDQVITAVNAVSDNTGIQAERVTAGAPGLTSGVRFRSVAFGSDAFVSVQRLGNSGSFAQIYQIDNDGPVPIDWATSAVTLANRDSGKDVVAIVNGAVASGRGLGLSVRDSSLDIEMTLTETFGTTVTGTPSAFTITGGGALYQLGPQVISSQQTNIGIRSLADSRIGGTLIADATGTLELQFLNSLKSGGINDLLKGNFIAASAVLETAIDEVSVLRGKLGAFERNTLQTNVRSLQAAVENVTAATSQIRDADFAAETSALTRAQVLTSAGTTVLATANSSIQNVLQLLG
jgi:flagellin